MKHEYFPKGLAITHIHHPGHQKDDSCLTMLNRVADFLAGLGREVDVMMNENLLQELSSNKKNFAAMLESVEAAQAKKEQEQDYVTSSVVIGTFNGSNESLEAMEKMLGTFTTNRDFPIW